VQEFIKCAKSFQYFCHKYVKIAHPKHGLIPFILFKYQQRVINDYDDHRFNIMSKFRQGGLTTVSVIWALWKCMFDTDVRIMLVSKTDREAIYAGDMARTAMDYMPQWLKPKMSKANEHEKHFSDTNSFLWSYTVEAARGKSITILLIDEAAFIADMDKHWKSIYPVISTGGSCAVISTVNGLGNWYEEIYHKAEAKKNAFHVIEIDFWEHPQYNDPKWVKEQRSNLGEKGFKQEVLRSFLGSGETYIPTEIIVELAELTENNFPARVLFGKWKTLKKEESISDLAEDGALWLWKEPVDGHEYIIGADCAEGVGEEGDNSCFQVIDMATLEQVAEFYSNTVPQHIFAQILNEIGIYFNTALVVVENMNGGAVLSSLQHDLAYENLYYDNDKTVGIKTGKNNRPLFLEAVQNRLMNGAIRVNSMRFVNELKTFIYNSKTKKAEAQKGRHDDAIMSMGLTLYVRDKLTRDMPVGAGGPKMNPLMESDIYKEIKQEILDASEEELAKEKEPDWDNVLLAEPDTSGLAAADRAA
jgi:hypothetical protein